MSIIPPVILGKKLMRYWVRIEGKIENDVIAFWQKKGNIASIVKHPKERSVASTLERKNYTTKGIFVESLNLKNFEHLTVSSPFG